jgi:translation initiation factor 2 subunit 2
MKEEKEEEFALSLLNKKKKKRPLKCTYYEMYDAMPLSTDIQSAFKIPPPSIQKLPKKSVWSNFETICKKLNRECDHVMKFFFIELSTTGNTDGENNLLIKGKFSSSQIENLLLVYISLYVKCPEC